MTFGRVAEAPPRAIRLVGWPKLVIFFFFLFVLASIAWMCTLNRGMYVNPHGEWQSASESQLQRIATRYTGSCSLTMPKVLIST